ncbi:hypothetical protein H4R33_002896 [Dimargaris cristalligena]|nr:hypothetical protein H4R33_002896 [Dimargaris cristalligena]
MGCAGQTQTQSRGTLYSAGPVSSTTTTAATTHTAAYHYNTPPNVEWLPAPSLVYPNFSDHHHPVPSDGDLARQWEAEVGRRGSNAPNIKDAGGGSGSGVVVDTGGHRHYQPQGSRRGPLAVVTSEMSKTNAAGIGGRKEEDADDVASPSIRPLLSEIDADILFAVFATDYGGGGGGGGTDYFNIPNK